ncbi:MAG: helix-turn-helix domain-containing protein [Clostridia bacterium]|nr:helix-turn-helix domain-containing protein [Clostridia bacterium]
MVNNYLGKTIKELRLEEGISQRELGNRLNVCNQTVSFWEIGQREPDLDTLLKIAKYFQVSTDYLLGNED